MFEVEFLIIIQFVLFCLGLVLILLPAFFVESEEFSREKLSSYECGFEPFEESRSPFEVQFYVVSVLFMLFDLEVSFLFPFILLPVEFLWLGAILSVFFYFFFLLVLGFIFEWQSGVLDWHN